MNTVKTIYTNRSNTVAIQMTNDHEYVLPSTILAITAVAIKYKGTVYSTANDDFTFNINVIESKIYLNNLGLSGLPVGVDKKTELLIYSNDILQGIVYGQFTLIVEENLPASIYPIAYGPTSKATGFIKADYDALIEKESVQDMTLTLNPVVLDNEYFVLFIPELLPRPSNFWDNTSQLQLMVLDEGSTETGISINNNNFYAIRSENLLTYPEGMVVKVSI